MQHHPSVIREGTDGVAASQPQKLHPSAQRINRSDSRERFISSRSSRGLTTEIKDAAVERVRQVCSGALFDRLFKVVTKFKLADGATQVLAGRLPADTPRNLRALFSRAVETKETRPRRRIEKNEECTASGRAMTPCEAAGVSFPSRPVCFLLLPSKT